MLEKQNDNCEWRNSISVSHFCVCSDGRIKNTKTGRILKPRKQHAGKRCGENEYHIVSCGKWAPGKRVNYYVHRLVCEAFIENKRNLPCVNHKNGLKSDNRAENLEWCSYAQNTSHAIENGLIPEKKLFKKSKDAKLTKIVRLLVNTGKKQETIIALLSGKWERNQIRGQYRRIMLNKKIIKKRSEAKRNAKKKPAKS
jgi:hypothetical protein